MKTPDGAVSQQVLGLAHGRDDTAFQDVAGEMTCCQCTYRGQPWNAVKLWNCTKLATWLLRNVCRLTRLESCAAHHVTNISHLSILVFGSGIVFLFFCFFCFLFCSSSFHVQRFEPGSYYFKVFAACLISNLSLSIVIWCYLHHFQGICSILALKAVISTSLVLHDFSTALAVFSTAFIDVYTISWMFLRLWLIFGNTRCASYKL